MTPHEFKENCMVGMLALLCSKAILDIMRQEYKQQALIVYIVSEKDYPGEAKQPEDINELLKKNITESLKNKKR
jgi:hypothetical protein